MKLFQQAILLLGFLVIAGPSLLGEETKSPPQGKEQEQVAAKGSEAEMAEGDKDADKSQEGGDAEELKEPEEVPEPKEISEPEKVAEPKETPEPKKIEEPKEIAEPEKIAEPKEISKPEVPQEGEKSDPPVAAEDSQKSGDTMEPDEEKKSDDTMKADEKMGEEKMTPKSGLTEQEAEAEEEAKSKERQRDPDTQFQVLGWKEWVQIGTKSDLMRAKLDSGARTSSLHAEGAEEFERDGRKWVRFSLKVPDDEGGKSILFKAPLQRVAKVKNTDGSVERRFVVELGFTIGERTLREEFTLNDRTGFTCPILLGRNALRHLGFVDCGRVDLAEKKIFK